MDLVPNFGFQEMHCMDDRGGKTALNSCPILRKNTGKLHEEMMEMEIGTYMKKSEVPTCSKQHVRGGSPPPKRGSEFRCCPGLNNLM